MSSIKAILTDIEGTTTPISFVHEVLFPYARERLAAFIAAKESDPEVAKALDAARKEGGIEGASTDDVVALLLRWIDEDKKAGPLKLLQGMIWQTGYEDGSLKGPVYDDAAEILNTWKARGLNLYVYSSGSVAAQKLIFGHSDHGDLTVLFSSYFDTGVGSKLEAESYGVIADRLDLPSGDILFLSDNLGEIAAAKQAGMATVQIDRETPLEMWAEGPVAGSFTAVEDHLKPGL